MHRGPRKRLVSVLGALGVAFVAAAGCSDTLNGTLNLITGPDDGFAQSPKPTSITIQLIDYLTGDASTLGQASLPASAGITLPPEDPTTIDIVRATGFEDGGAVVSGASIPLTLGELEGATLSLFVQRNGQFSRLPSTDGGTALLDAAPSSSPLLATYSEFLLIADGTGKSVGTQVYDTFLWGVASGAPNLPIAPLSIAYIDSYTGADAATEAGSIAAVLSIGKNDNGAWLDLTDSTSVDAEVTADAIAPPGASFADVAGGQSILSSDGSVFIVGATRQSGKPTSVILHVGASGVLSWATLNSPRLGAAAAYVQSVGLYVFGGNQTGDGSTAAGAELLPDTLTLAINLTGIPSDPTTGAGVVALDSTDFLLAGGVTAKGASPVRLYTGDLMSNPPAPTTSTLPATFVTTQVFGLNPPSASAGWSALVVGNDASGMTSAYKLTQSGTPTLIPFRVPRSHAQAIVLPNGSLGLVGGDATTMESFIP
jgi:hypothetical protein